MSNVNFSAGLHLRFLLLFVSILGILASHEPVVASPEQATAAQIHLRRTTI